MVWIECHDTGVFLMPFQEGTHYNLNSASKVENWIVVDILRSLINCMLSLADWIVVDILR